MITRPNGKVYRPRKPGLRAHAWGEIGDPDGWGVVVLGTLDDSPHARNWARAACIHWYADPDLFDIAHPGPGWWRDGYGPHGRQWINDPERGAPGVMYTWTEKP